MPPSPPHRILVVNDQAPERGYLSELLRYQGYSVDEAADADAALTLLERHPPHLVISDARVPPGGAVEFVRRVRALPGMGHVPIAFYTQAVAEREAHAVAQACGIQDVLVRTGVADPIVDRVHALVTRTRRITETPETSHPGAPPKSATQLLELVQELVAAEQQMTGVAEIGEKLIAERDPAAVLPMAVNALRSLTGASWSIGGLFDDSARGDASRVVVGLDETAAVLDDMPLTEEFRGAMMRRTPVRWDRSAKGADIFGGRWADSPESGLAVPIATPARVYGWLSAMTRIRGSAFSDRDARAATIIGSQTGVVYENASLITRLTRHSDQLETTVSHTTFALEAARTGVWTLELPTGRWQGSEALRTLLDLSSADAIQTLDMFLEGLSEVDRERVSRAFHDAVADRTGLNVEFSVRPPDGGTRVLQALGRVSVDGQGRAVRMHGVLTDITDLRRLELQLRQAQRTETVGLLAGGIAHDFNNMLTAILGYARLAEDQLEQAADPTVEIQQISKAAERASLLTRQLLAFSRQQVLEPVPLDLNAIIEELATMLRRLIGDHIQVHLSLDSTVPEVFGDRSQIEQVVMNLVVNARDAMPSGGRIDIGTSVVALESTDRLRGEVVVPGRYVVLSIADSGPGVPEEVRSRIFDPFFTTKERGTGLGLATVDGICRQSGGYVDMVSGTGQGTTFLAYLPAFQGDVAPFGSPALSARPQAGSERVLVVEDEPEVRRLVKTVLERAGYRVVDAASASEAERLLGADAQGLELLITDVVMPGGTGADLYRRLTHIRPALKVIFMSGYPDDLAVAEAVARPGTSFLQKPFTIETLVRRVREALAADA